MATAHAATAAAIAKVEAERQKFKSRAWRRLFSEFSASTWAAAAGIVHEANECATFDANDMAKDWSKVWCPDEESFDDSAFTSNWPTFAEQATGMPTSEKEDTWLPSLQEFAKAIQKGRGSAGFDGWHSQELKLLLRRFPSAISELFELWV